MIGSTLTPVKKTPVVQQVINKITDEIIAGRLKPGEKVPTERELMDALGCSRNKVREAMRTLIAYGVVEIRRPEGTFVCDKASRQMLSPQIYQALLGSDDAAGDIIGFRRIVETGIYQLIAQRSASPEEISHLKDLNADLDQKIRKKKYDIAEIADADMRLHTAISALTGNQLVVAVHDFLAELTRDSRYRTIQKIFNCSAQNYLVEVHEEAIRFIEGKSEKTLGELLDYTFLYWKDSYRWSERPEKRLAEENR